MLDVIRNLFSETNPIPVKEAMNQMGLDVGPCRLPLYTMDADKAATLKQALIDFGIEVI
jgi:4-hydroxy-tetrahydrodipicolinate synthase